MCPSGWLTGWLDGWLDNWLAYCVVDYCLFSRPSVCPSIRPCRSVGLSVGPPISVSVGLRSVGRSVGRSGSACMPVDGLSVCMYATLSYIASCELHVTLPRSRSSDRYVTEASSLHSLTYNLLLQKPMLRGSGTTSPYHGD